MSFKILSDNHGPYFAITDGEKSITVRPELIQRRKTGMKSDLLARAIGFKKKLNLSVLDLTAGLCRDAYHLAGLGCEVVALEKNQNIYNVMLPYVKLVSSEVELSLKQADALVYLDQLNAESFSDIIYYDPMFPEKAKKALSGKESELLKKLAPIALPQEEHAILDLAMKKCLKRVVVKRPLKASHILPKPNAVFKGKSVRYDVYISKFKPEFR